MSLFPVLRATNMRDPFSDFDRLFDAFFTAPRTSENMASNVPRANLLASDDSYTIELASPGFSRSDFNIEVDNNVLSVSVSSSDGDEYTKNLKRREFSYSSFSRSWSLPENANIEGIDATYEAGILTVNVPVIVNKSSTRKIDVG